MNKGLNFIERAPYASIGRIWLTTAEYILLYIIIICIFYFLYDKKFWLLKISTVCTLFLFGSLSVEDIHMVRSNQIAWLNLRKHPGIIFKHGDSAIVVTDVKPRDKTYQYSIQPYLDSCGVSTVKIIDLHQPVKTPWLAKENNLIQFMHTRIFILDGTPDPGSLAEKITTDYIYMTGNAAPDLSTINNYIDYRMLVIDGSNSDDLAYQAERQANIKKVNYKLLKRNNSLISVSN